MRKMEKSSPEEEAKQRKRISDKNGKLQFLPTSSSPPLSEDKQAQVNIDEHSADCRCSSGARNMVHSQTLQINTPETLTEARLGENQDSETMARHIWKASHCSEYVYHECHAGSEAPDDCLEALRSLNRLASLDSLERDDSSIREAITNQVVSSNNSSMVKLCNNIHRLHALVRNLTSENDAQTTEILSMHEELRVKEGRIVQLEVAVTKLYKQNVKLKNQSKVNQSKSKKLFQQVKEFATNAAKRKQDETFQKLATQIQHHEMILVSRERTNSNFSDKDGLQDFLPDTASVSSFDTSVSTQSSIYDDGVATLRISHDTTTTRPSPISDDVEVFDSKSNHLSSIIAKGDSHDQEDKRVVAPTPPCRQVNQNPFAMLFGHHHAQEYTLHFQKPFELQFVALLEMGEESNEKCDPVTTFAVCGFHGFDSTANPKPPIGARLLRIDKQELDPKWTVQDLEKNIQDLGSRVSMTFRNSHWSTTQKEVLQLAIQEQKRLHLEDSTEMTKNQGAFLNPFTRKRCPSSDKISPASKPLLGFLNFAISNSQECSSSNEMEQPPQVVYDVGSKEQPSRGSLHNGGQLYCETDTILPVGMVISGNQDAVQRSEGSSYMPLHKALSADEGVAEADPPGGCIVLDNIRATSNDTSKGRSSCTICFQGVSKELERNELLDAITAELQAVAVEEFALSKDVIFNGEEGTAKVLIYFSTGVDESKRLMHLLDNQAITLGGKTVDHTVTWSENHERHCGYEHQLEQPSVKGQDAGELFKSSMMQMGKFFSFAHND